MTHASLIVVRQRPVKEECPCRHVLKASILFRDRASAMVLEMPGRCEARIRKLWITQIEYRVRVSAMTAGDRLVPVFRHSTAAWLSH